MTPDVRVWPRVFTAAECEQLATRVRWGCMPTVYEDAEFAAELSALMSERLAGLPPLEWTPLITASIHVPEWHYDKVFAGETHKLCLYLDEAEASVFRDVKVEGGLGTVVLFDIGLEHRSPAGSRRVIGMRVRL